MMTVAEYDRRMYWESISGGPSHVDCVWDILHQSGSGSISDRPIDSRKGTITSLLRGIAQRQSFSKKDGSKVISNDSSSTSYEVCIFKWFLIELWSVAKMLQYFLAYSIITVYPLQEAHAHIRKCRNKIPTSSVFNSVASCCLFRYPLLLDRLYKATPDEHPDKQEIHLARKYIQQTLSSINAVGNVEINNSQQNSYVSVKLVCAYLS